MYAGTTFRNKSGHIVGVHQKIDRIARRSLKSLIGAHAEFPSIKEILHFEGNNGPDAIKRKSPSVDEPWHYVDPSNPDDSNIYRLIKEHRENLTDALRQSNSVRAAFEASWLAHAVVDGLTPAHHHALDAKIEELWGKPHYERLSIKEKNIIKGINVRDSISKNWQYWGFGGVFTAHIAFELGVASTIAPLNYKKLSVSKDLIGRARLEGFEVVYAELVHEIYDLELFEEFGARGWTRKLARQTRETLLPAIISAVTLAWYVAYEESIESK